VLNRLKPIVRRTVTWSGLVTRPVTLGVRGFVVDGQRRIFLVRHGYLPGWYLPGGGVDPGESAGRALVRELEEEGGLRVEESRIFGLYLNSRTSRRDHVALFVVEAFTMSPSPFVPNAEIREVGFFPLDALPEETTGATRRRIAEVVEGAPRADIW